MMRNKRSYTKKQHKASQILVPIILFLGLAIYLEISVYIIVFCFLLSLITFFVYGADKEKAINGDWRIPELSLHVLALIGGWPGAIIAQNFYRHKTKKESFLGMFALTVILNCVVIYLLNDFVFQ